MNIFEEPDFDVSPSSFRNVRKKADQTSHIYDFPQLKSALSKMGIEIGIAGTYRTIDSIDILPDDVGERLIIENDGIYYIDDTGVKQRGFLYKRRYYLKRFGKPRIHVCKCSTILSFMRSSGSIPEYRLANTDEVKVLDWDNNDTETKVSNLPLCKFCAAMLPKLNVSGSADFAEILREAGEASPEEQIELDFYGYVRDWEQISLAYRTKMNFTCERCGLHIENDFDHAFMHTHHKNGNKTDNREINLECLCIRCHSEVDAMHRHNFSRGGNKVLLDDFLTKYSNVVLATVNRLSKIKRNNGFRPFDDDFDFIF